MNFRSRAEVLDATNYIFYQIMKAALGDVEYDAKAALYCGAEFPEMNEVELATTDNIAEVMLIDGKQIKEAEEIEDSSREVEARAVAKRIQEMVGSHRVYDRDMDAYRPAQYSDIVILTRAMTGWADVYYEELMEAGIPTSVPSQEGYFSSIEVALLLNYLRVIDNPRQDIPLAAVLHSVFGNLTSEEMAVIKARYKKSSFSSAVYQYADMYHKEDVDNSIDEHIQKKLRECLSRIERLQKQVIYMGIHEILWEIYETTHYREYVYALPGGEQRLANVDMLLEKATSFEGTSYKGVFNFIRYIEQLQQYQIEEGEASITDELDNVVRIMSIHKSKGLEFPIVFVIGMGKLFNEMDTRKLVITHPDQGLAMDVISAVNRTKDKSLLKQVMKERMKEDNLGEELRVLYVAMTRAKEKLILVGKLQDVERSLMKIKQNVEPTVVEPLPLDYLELSSARSYLEWVLPSVYMKKDAPIVVKIVDASELDHGKLNDGKGLDSEENARVQSHIELNEGAKAQLQQQMEFQYTDAYKKDYQLKISVTELKKRQHILEAKVQEEQEVDIVTNLGAKYGTETKIITQEIIPEFIEKKLQEKEEKHKKDKQGGAQRGTAYHRFLELWDFSQEYSEIYLKQLLEIYVVRGQMTETMVTFIEPDVIKNFMGNSLVQRMKAAAVEGNLHKEQPFVLGIDARKIYGTSNEVDLEVDEENTQGNEIIVVQGIIDVYFEEDDELVVMDYKTDNVSNMEKLREMYASQLDYYGQALEQLTGKKVKEKIIYSLKLQDYIMM